MNEARARGASDRALLYASAFLRALATGLAGVLLGIYLAQAGFSVQEIGLIISAGLLGMASAVAWVTIAGDTLGRRKALFWLALLSAAGGLGVAFSSHVLLASAAAFIGMLNGMGRDRGAALVLEQAVLPSAVPDSQRTRVFAWYNVLQDAGHAAGGLLAATPSLLRGVDGTAEATGSRAVMMLYPLAFLATALLYLQLSQQAEAPRPRLRQRVTLQSRRLLWRISALFALDSAAGGFLGSALLAYFFYRRFGASESAIAVLFTIARLANAFSHLGASWIAKRIGLVNTMVFTHIPSNVLLIALAFAPGFWSAAVLFLLREVLVEMDVPARQSYVMGVVEPEERTLAAGLTHIVRSGGWAATPYFAGSLMQALALGAPLIAGAVMKIAYDVLLYFALRAVKPPEESSRQQAGAASRNTLPTRRLP